MDSDFVRELARTMTAGTILLVGPQADPDPGLFDLPRVAWIPALPYEELPGLAAAADVLIMPYRDIPVTRAMQPLKLKEYLATGKPAVARSLPAMQPWADSLDLAASPRDFAAAVVRRFNEGIPENQRRARERLVRESWEGKAAEFERLALGRIAAELGG
jgi:glycosyltransferase involved in cell wall biosynthesis